MTKQKGNRQTTQRADKSPQKTTYRVSHWAAYNDSLVQRGAITLWIDAEVRGGWPPRVQGRRQRGGPPKESERAMECVLTLKAVFHRPYRQTEGCGRSMMAVLAVNVTLPDYTTWCLRSADLTVELSPAQGQGAKHIVLDSTGLKVYGQGEWKVRQHGVSKRRTGRKLHLSVQDATHSLEAVALTEASLDHAEAGGDLLDETEGPREQVSGDGAWDKRKLYEACQQREVERLALPPQRQARIWPPGNSSKPPLPRDQNLRRIRRVGRQHWKHESGYHRRSLAETAVFRFQTILGKP